MTSELGSRNAGPEPYVGPRPFEEEDRELFFGRDRDIHEVLGLLLSSRTFLIYAPSGAGKTSLLNAGLRPHLTVEPVECWSTARIQSVISPSTLEQIANVYVFALLSSWQKVTDLDELARVTFSEYLRSWPAKVDDEGVELPLLVFIDQFEELFTSYPERWADREAFFVQLHEALAEHPRLRLVLLMREDFLAHLDSHVKWLPDKLRSRYRLELLRERAALDAIRRPAVSRGRSYAQGVAEQLVRDLRTTLVDDGLGEVRPVLAEFVEPVQLQVTCKTLWDSLPQEVSVITARHLKDFGDVDQALTSFYDGAVRQVCLGAHVSEDQLRRGIEELFITEMGTRNMAYQGRSVTGLMPNKVVQMLEDLHVVRAEWRAGARWYELTHDRLIRPIETSNLKFFHRLPAETDPDRVRRLAKKAMAGAEQLFAAGRYKEALQAAEKGYRHFTTGDDIQSAANALALMGDIHSAAGEVAESLQRYQESVKVYERLGDSYSTARVYGEMGRRSFDDQRYGLATQWYSRAIEHLGDDPALFRGRGLARWYDGQLEQAVDDFNHELRLNPDSVAALNNRGQALSEMGRAEQAIDDLDRVVRLETDRLLIARARSARAYALHTLQRFEEADRDFEASLAMAANDAWGQLRLGLAAMARGDRERAERALTGALAARNPSLPEAQRKRAASLMSGLRGPAEIAGDQG